MIFLNKVFSILKMSKSKREKSPLHEGLKDVMSNFKGGEAQAILRYFLDTIANPAGAGLSDADKSLLTASEVKGKPYLPGFINDIRDGRLRILNAKSVGGGDLVTGDPVFLGDIMLEWLTGKVQGPMKTVLEYNGLSYVYDYPNTIDKVYRAITSVKFNQWLDKVTKPQPKPSGYKPLYIDIRDVYPFGPTRAGFIAFEYWYTIADPMKIDPKTKEPIVIPQKAYVFMRGGSVGMLVVLKTYHVEGLKMEFYEEEEKGEKENAKKERKVRFLDENGQKVIFPRTRGLDYTMTEEYEQNFIQQWNPTVQFYVPLVSQAKVSYGDFNYVEIPAGMMDESKKSVKVAVKEIQEEIGAEILEDQLQLIGTIVPSAGGSDEQIDLYYTLQTVSPNYVELMRDSLQGNISENERIMVLVVTLEEFMNLKYPRGVEKNKKGKTVKKYYPITDAKALSALVLAEPILQQLV